MPMPAEYPVARLDPRAGWLRVAAAGNGEAEQAREGLDGPLRCCARRPASYRDVQVADHVQRGRSRDAGDSADQQPRPSSDT